MPIGPPNANPYYDDFAAANGMDPSLTEKWKAAIMPPGGIIDRGRELGAKYLDAGAGALQSASDLAGKAPPIPGMQTAQLGLMGAGALAPRLANAIRPAPRDEASTPSFQRPQEPGTPYAPPPTSTPGLSMGGAPTGGGPGGVVSTKESELTTTHKGHAVSDEVRNAADQAHVDARLANQLGLEAAQEHGQAAGMAAAIQSNAVQAYNALEQKEQLRRDAAVRAQQQQLAQDVDAVRTGAVNPNKYLEEMGIGSKIFGMIGMALGGAYAGFTGRENPVAQQINQQIANSIHAQETNLANKRSSVGARQGLIDQMTKQYGDESKGRLASHMMLLEGVRNQLQAASTGITNKDAQAHAAAVDAQLGQEQAKLQAQFQKQAQDDVTVQTQDVYMSRNGGGKGGGAAGPGGGLGKQGETQTRELSENLTKTGIPQATAQLDAIDRALSGVKGDDIPASAACTSTRSCSAAPRRSSTTSGTPFSAPRRGRRSGRPCRASRTAS
jgi:hypothetical protein